MSSTFRVLTLNIHKGFALGPKRLVLHSIRKTLRESKANLVFLQEVVGRNQKHGRRIKHWPAETQLEFLADTVWSHHAYGKNAIYSHGHHGNAILSEHPFISWNNIDASFLRISQRGFLHGTIAPNIHLICVHLGLFERERQQQVFLLLDHIRQHIPDHAPLIIAGDFNDWRHICHRTLLDNLDLHEAHVHQHGHCASTYPAFYPILPMDRIYLRGFDISACSSMAGPGWRDFSDHRALLADIMLSSPT
ncbi:MAG: endonuclease/exonuclease/phosphatase family protein [Pseudomonadales bacterium]|nr:endonuclease/exonuclease/phosphatase family protein [Pseudomonadales bacterium]